ncbi:MAG TPA: DUF1622 domain-containing protein [Azospirillum sp.]|nr:DUF1622 domain-containing protein [Azospirillum sp.]
MAATEMDFAAAPRGALTHAAELITAGIEAAGIVIIVLAALIASCLFLRDGFRAGRWTAAYERYRANLGRGILLGLELLVAADIVGTVAAPMDIRTIGVLALVVLIRTFLSFSLEVEIRGHWPWQDSRMRRPHDGESRP